MVPSVVSRQAKGTWVWPTRVSATRRSSRATRACSVVRTYSHTGSRGLPWKSGTAPPVSSGLSLSRLACPESPIASRVHSSAERAPSANTSSVCAPAGAHVVVAGDAALGLAHRHLDAVARVGPVAHQVAQAPPRLGAGLARGAQRGLERRPIAVDVAQDRDRGRDGHLPWWRAVRATIVRCGDSGRGARDGCRWSRDGGPPRWPGWPPWARAASSGLLRWKLWSSGVPAPEPTRLADWFDPAELARNRDYREGLWTMAAIGVPLAPAVAVGVALLGGRWRPGVVRRPAGAPGGRASSSASGSRSATVVVALPLSIARYAWGRDYGIVTQPVPGWLLDLAKGVGAAGGHRGRRRGRRGRGDPPAAQDVVGGARGWGRGPGLRPVAAVAADLRAALPAHPAAARSGAARPDPRAGAPRGA